MRIALTGHRPQRLGLPDDELDIKWARIEIGRASCRERV